MGFLVFFDRMRLWTCRIQDISQGYSNALESTNIYHLISLATGSFKLPSKYTVKQLTYISV